MSSGKFANKQNSYGSLLGKMIRAHREQSGMSQQELAVQAFGKESAKARISELENGRVANPAAWIVGGIAQALGISAVKITSLRNESLSPDADHLAKGFNISVDLLRSVAFEFGLKTRSQRQANVEIT